MSNDATEATEAADAVADAVTEAPENDGGAIETPETPAAEAPDWEARVTAWGGADAIDDAVALQQALQTQEGVRALFEAAGRSLGFGDDKIAGWFADGETPPAEKADPWADIVGDDPDRPLTAADVAKMLDRVVSERVEGPLQERQAAEYQATVRQNVRAGLDHIGITDQKVAQIVCNLADQYVTDADLTDPTRVREALNRAYTDWQGLAKQAQDKYVAEKKEQAAAQPKKLAGGTSGAEAAPEPQSVAEATARVRAALGQAG